MATKRFSLLSLILLGTIILSACVSGTPVAQGPNDPNLAHTQAVQTVVAIATQNALPTASVATATPYPTPTLAPTATALPTQTPLPTATAVPPTPTAIPLPCNVAKFIKDVTAADGTVFGYGNRFTKTWRLQNVGSCSWSADYSLVYRSGDQMDGSGRIYLDQTVRPGETVDVSVSLVAPSEVGTYTGYWALKSDSGEIFGIGASGDKAVWVSIKVENKLSVDYTKDLCENTWSTNTGSLGCPVTENNNNAAYYEVVKNPVLEGGYKDNESAIVMVPPAGEGTYIELKTKEFKVDNEHFRAVIGCMDGAESCNVKFTLDYQVDGQAPKSLGTWVEKYDQSVTKIDIDLSFLEDKNVRLLLTVMSNGSSVDDEAFWLLPALYE